MAKIKESVPPPETVYQQNETIVARDAKFLSNDERLVLSLVNGERTINDIYGLVTLRRFDVIRIIHKLEDTDYIENSGDSLTEISH